MSASYYTPAEIALIDDPRTMDAICSHVGAGGSLEELCHTWNRDEAGKRGQVRFGAIWRWICEDNDHDGSRFSRWLASHNLQAQADVARADAALRAIAFADVRGLLDEDGRLKPVSEWPHDIAQMVAGLDVAEIFGKGEDAGVVEGLLKKVKLSDRLKALELLLKRRGALIEKRELSGTLKLDDLLVNKEPKNG